jgi:hypothetical protein
MGCSWTHVPGPETKRSWSNHWIFTSLTDAPCIVYFCIFTYKTGPFGLGKCRFKYSSTIEHMGLKRTCRIGTQTSQFWNVFFSDPWMYTKSLRVGKKTRTRFLDSPLFVTHSPPQFYQDLHDPPEKCQQKPYSSSSYSPFTHQFMKMFMYLPKSYPWLNLLLHSKSVYNHHNGLIITPWCHYIHTMVYTSICGCMDAWLHGCMHACMYVCMFVGISVCMDVCMHVCSYAFMHIYIGTYVCMYVRRYVGAYR